MPREKEGTERLSDETSLSQRPDALRSNGKPLDSRHLSLNPPFTVALADLLYPVKILELSGEAASLLFPMETLPLRHASPTLGCRMKLDGLSIAYCPDTGYCQNAVKLGRTVNLLIAECAFKPGQVNEEGPHLNPETAARIAIEAGAKRLVLTHFDATLYQNLSDRKRAEAVADAIFAAPTTARVGLRIVL